ncbi:MAG: phosphoribosylglycinamide formyltransferase [Acutalibacteraceae bacterium]
MQNIKTAVFVSGGGTNLQALIDAVSAGVIRDADLSLVLSSARGAYALTRAENARIPTAVVPRKEMASQQDFESEILRILEENEIELIVLAGFLSILSADFTKRYENRIINVHPSLIPAFCGKGFYGLRVHEAALNYGVKVSGATTHFVNEIPDGGKIIMQKAVEIEEGDTPEILQRRIMEQAEWIILPQSVQRTAAAIKAAKN